MSKELGQILNDMVLERWQNMNISLELTAFDCHLLLKELEHALCFVNRDTSNANYLWEKISTQLNDKETKINVIPMDK